MNSRELTPQEKIDTLAKPMLEFIKKVESGRARSRDSYMNMIQALLTAGITIPGHETWRALKS